MGEEEKRCCGDALALAHEAQPGVWGLIKPRAENRQRHAQADAEDQDAEEGDADRQRT